MYSVQQAIELGTLITLIGREARDQSYAAMLGVAWSVANRVKSPRYWGTGWLSVCAYKFAYSSMTAPGDPNLVVWPEISQTAWQTAAKAAEMAYLGTGPDPVSGATHYHNADMPHPPAWASAPDTEFIIQIGAFKFYKAF